MLPFCWRTAFCFLLLGPVLALAVFGPAAAAPQQRTVAFINAGTEPIFVIRIGHHATRAWSEDLLGSTNVVDVGDFRSLRVSLTQTCWYDVQFAYRGGAPREIDNVDLCSATHLFLKETTPSPPAAPQADRT